MDCFDMEIQADEYAWWYELEEDYYVGEEDR